MKYRLLVTTPETAGASNMDDEAKNFNYFMMRAAAFDIKAPKALSALNQEMFDWCDENLKKGDWKVWDFQTVLGIIMFKESEHMMLFKLRFG